MTIGIVVAEWNKNITEKLLEGACNTLEKHGVQTGKHHLKTSSRQLRTDFWRQKIGRNKRSGRRYRSGMRRRGDTPHFDYVCSGVTQGITELNLMYDIPFIFGLLTTDTMQQQSEDRAGGRYGKQRG